ncbi:MAG: acylphosphatase [Pseudomonadota bacterium]
MEEWSLVVSGRVQGVFYRASVLKFVQNEKLNLRGFIKNLSDGRVQVLAQGETVELEKLALFCRQGPPLAQVEEVQINKSPNGGGKYGEFAIHY